MRRPPKRAECVVLACVAAIWGASCTPRVSPTVASPPLTLFVASDLRGYLGPCGCSENMRGGIARAASQVLVAKQRGPVLFVDAGDSLFGDLTFTEAERLQEEQKAHTLARAFIRMGLAVRGVGPLDNARGEAFRKGLQLPEVLTGEAKVLHAGSFALGVVSGPSREVLARAATQARKSGAVFVVGLVHRPLDEVTRLGTPALPGVDLLVAAHGGSELSGEENRLVRAQTPVVQIQSKGRSLLRVELSFRAEGDFELVRGVGDQERELLALEERAALLNREVNAPDITAELKKLKQAKLDELLVRQERLAATPTALPEGKNAFNLRFVPLEANLPGEPGTLELVDAYDRDVGRLNLEWARAHGQDCPKPAPGESSYVGSAACAECHEEAFFVWKASKHAVAYATLEHKGKQFHLNCVGCHVVGHERPGGVCRVDQVKGRSEVGCESCHGPGSRHVDAPSDDNISLGNTAQACVGCHDSENSPHFDFATYLPRILGPGHAAKPRPPHR